LLFSIDMPDVSPDTGHGPRVLSNREPHPGGPDASSFGRGMHILDLLEDPLRVEADIPTWQRAAALTIDCANDDFAPPRT